MLLSELYNIPSLEWSKKNINIYHIHSLANSIEWCVGEIYDTITFERKDSYNTCKKWREDTFEKVRQNIGPQYPSRRKCLFLCLDSHLNYWKKSLRRGVGTQIFKIELIKGKIVFIDEAIYNIERFSNDEMMEDALDYWNGMELETNPIYTGLFEGEFKLVEESK